MRKRHSLHRLLPLLLAGLLGLVPLAQAQSSASIDSIVALVESDIIMRSELDTAILSIVERIRASGGNLPPQNLLEKQVLERLILRKLQVQRALQTGIRVSDSDIDQAMMTLAQQNGLTISQMRQAIESDGEDFQEFRKSVGEEIMAERLRQRVVSGMEPVSDTEIDILLLSEDFAGGEYEVAHIMIGLPDGSTPRQVDEAAQRIADIHTRLEEGLDFSSAAISFSESPEALEGGNIGWRDLNSIPREFAEAIRNLEAGQYTQPIRSTGGFHIVRVNDFRERRQVLIEEYRANHILIATNELVTPRNAMEEIGELRERLMEGQDFADLAREHSDDVTSANLGGDMGWIDPTRIGDRFKVMLESLEDGEISEAFQSEAGWHLVQRTGHRETDVTDEAMRNMARQTIMQNRADSEIEGYLRQLREEAYVDIRLPT